MKVIRPVAITAAMLVSSTVPEADYPAWSGVTAYAVGDRVIKGHRIWESLQAANTNHDPETDASDPPFWLRVSSTNRWRMFDEAVNSQTTATGSIVVELTPGQINAVGAVELSGSTMRVQLFDGAALVYDQTRLIDDTPVEDWWDYFFEPFDPAGALVFENVPSYLTGKVVVTIAGSGTVGCGSLVLGTQYTLGKTMTNARAGITDYSKKSTNAFGVTEVVERSYSKRSNQQLFVETRQLRRLQSLLASLRATPCLWIGEDDTALFAPLVVFGFFRDFQLEIPGRDVSFCSLDIEGII